jgi:hypothetical protein
VAAKWASISDVVQIVLFLQTRNMALNFIELSLQQIPGALNPLKSRKEKVLIYSMFPDFRKSIPFFGIFPCFASLSFWQEQKIHEDEYAPLVEW